MTEMLFPQFPIIIFDKTFDGGVLVLIYRTVVPCAGDSGLMGTGHCLETFLIFMAQGVLLASVAGGPGMLLIPRNAQNSRRTKCFRDPKCHQQQSLEILLGKYYVVCFS